MKRSWKNKAGAFKDMIRDVRVNVSMLPDALGSTFSLCRQPYYPVGLSKGAEWGTPSFNVWHAVLINLKG